VSFQKFSGDETPGPSQREGATLSCTQYPIRALAGCGAQASRCWDPNLAPLNFPAVVAPLYSHCWRSALSRCSCLLLVSQFLDDYEPTKVDSYRKPIMLGGDQVMLDIVDTAGQEDYAAVRDHYLRAADGCLCVFSLSEPESLQDIIDLRSASRRCLP